MISNRSVLYFDTCEVQSKRHVKNAFVLCAVVCLCECVNVWVCVHTPLCECEKLALKAILSLWSLWWNSWRGTARGLFCKSGQSLSDCERLPLSPCITLRLFLTSESRAKDMISHARQLYLTQTAPSKQQHDCVLSYLLVWRGYGIFFISLTCVCVWVFMFVSGYLQGKTEKLWPTIQHPAILISAPLSTSTPEGGSYQRAWFKSLGFKALGRDWTVLSHFSEKYSNLVYVRKSK